MFDTTAFGLLGFLSFGPERTVHRHCHNDSCDTGLGDRRLKDWLKMLDQVRNGLLGVFKDILPDLLILFLGERTRHRLYHHKSAHAGSKRNSPGSVTVGKPGA